MKQLIIIIGTIILGIYIFNMMVGNDPGSLKNISKEIMLETIERYEAVDMNTAGVGNFEDITGSQTISKQGILKRAIPKEAI